MPDIKNNCIKHLEKLCNDISERPVASKNNILASDYFNRILKSYGFKTRRNQFDCIDWEDQGSTLKVSERYFEVHTGPYSVGCAISAPFCVVKSIEQLRDINSEGKIILLKDEITEEQLMPKNFPFYNPEHHQEIIKYLEKSNCRAIIAATSKNPEVVAGEYPFPFIEDGDFDIPSVYMKDKEGDRLESYEGKIIDLEISSKRKPAKGYNVVAQKGESKGKIVFCAHIDTKKGTPGAIDDAGGVTVLLLLAELLVNYNNKYTVEIVALNGEDYYSNPGELLYLENNKERLSDISLAVNLDGVGYYKGKTAYSTYECPTKIKKITANVFNEYKEILAGEPWYQGDHMMFVQNQRPALALTSTSMEDMLTIVHTPDDNLDIVDKEKLVVISKALYKLIIDFK